MFQTFLTYLFVVLNGYAPIAAGSKAQATVNWKIESINKNGKITITIAAPQKMSNPEKTYPKEGKINNFPLT